MREGFDSCGVTCYTNAMLEPKDYAVAKELREISREYDGPGPLTLWVDRIGQWALCPPGDVLSVHACAPVRFSAHSEHVPGDGTDFDAMAMARRLLAGLPTIVSNVRSR